MELKIGSAPDSWGIWFADDPQQTPWTRFLDEVAAAGYEWIELGPYGYLPTEVPHLRDELQQRGLKVAGTFAMGNLEDDAAWPELERQILGAGAVLPQFAAEYLVLIDDVYTNLFTGEPLAPQRLDPAAWEKLLRRTNEIGRMALERFGLKTVFHPHAETHVEYEDQITALLEGTDPRYVALCLDVGHHAYRHGDPVAFLRRHHDRIPYLHLKSVDAAKRDQVARENIPFAKAVAMDLFCEPSSGAVDFLALRDLLRELDFKGFAIAEQDMYPAPADKPFPIAQRTRAFFREIGLG